MQDAWIRNEGGGGITRVIQDGNVWEKVGGCEGWRAKRMQPRRRRLWLPWRLAARPPPPSNTLHPHRRA